MAKIIIDADEYNRLKSSAARAPQEERYYPPEVGTLDWAIDQSRSHLGPNGVYYNRHSESWDYYVDSEGQD